jgi:hypothetical protein
MMAITTKSSTNVKAELQPTDCPLFPLPLVAKETKLPDLLSDEKYFFISWPP